MADPAERIEGKCLCGAVTVRATPRRRHVEACHCTMCRKWGGAAYLGVQCGSDVEFSGEEHVVRYRSSDWAERGFCGQCGSNLFFHYLPGDTYGILAGLFPDDALEPLAEEIFIDEMPDYYAFAGDAERLTGPEVMAKFGVGKGGATRILVDADACPVKDEVYKVAWRREVPVTVVSNARIRLPDHPLIERVVVSDAFDAADDWIADQADQQAVVITGDILLADRCLKKGATVIAPNGKPFTAASIGGAIATRAILADLRVAADGITGGPPPFAKADRSRFLQALDSALVRLERG